MESQEGPGVLDLHGQGEEMWINCLAGSKKEVFLKIYQFLSELVSQDQIFPNAATAAELSIHI